MIHAKAQRRKEDEKVMALSEPKTIESASAETTPALRDSPQRWWLLALLFTAMLISYVHRSALSVAAPFISKDLNLSKAEMGVLLSSFFWVYASFSGIAHARSGK